MKPYHTIIYGQAIWQKFDTHVDGFFLKLRFQFLYYEKMIIFSAVHLQILPKILTHAHEKTNF